jgi:hypothetical protein
MFNLMLSEGDERKTIFFFNIIRSFRGTRKKIEKIIIFFMYHYQKKIYIY